MIANKFNSYTPTILHQISLLVMILYEKFRHSIKTNKYESPHC